MLVLVCVVSSKTTASATGWPLAVSSTWPSMMASGLGVLLGVAVAVGEGTVGVAEGATLVAVFVTWTVGFSCTCVGVAKCACEGSLVCSPVGEFEHDTASVSSRASDTKARRYTA